MTDQQTTTETQTTTQTATETPNPLQAKVDELTKQLDELKVGADKKAADLEAKLAESQRQYNIAIKTGSKTEAQAKPANDNPVMAWVESAYGARS